MGRNLIPIDSTKFLENNYRLKLSANDYHTQIIPAQLKNKTFSPTADAATLNQSLDDPNANYDFNFRDNLLGVRLYPL